MATNRRDLKSYVRYDGSGRAIPGSNVLRKNMPKVGKWKETQAHECCNYVPQVLQRTFYSILEGSEGNFTSSFAILFVQSGVVNGKDAYERIQYYDNTLTHYSKYICRYDLDLETYVIIEEYYFGGVLDSSTQMFYGDDQFVNSPLEITSWTQDGGFYNTFLTFETTKSQFEKFDITANWASLPIPVTDEASFKQFLELGQDGEGNINNFVNVEIKNFSLTGGRLQCDLSLEGEYLYLSNIGITEIKSFGGFNGTLAGIYISYNQFVNFDPIVALPSRITDLIIQGGSLINFDPSLPLPDSLRSLFIDGNSLTEFNPSLPLPNSLIYLALDFNDLTTFDPDIALPDSIVQLTLRDNQLTVFNPSLPLPSSLLDLDIGQNLLTEFNLTIPLPESLMNLILYNNQMTTAGYIASEPWANAMNVIPGRGDILIYNNINSASGTNLETILISKGWSVTA